jgi:hypothetical protein
MDRHVASCCTIVLIFVGATWAVANGLVPLQTRSLRIILTDETKSVLPDAVVGVLTADGTVAEAVPQADGTYRVTGIGAHTVLQIDHPVYDGGDVELDLPLEKRLSVHLQVVDGLVAQVAVRSQAAVAPTGAAPPNDFCEGAIEVGCNSMTTFDNTSATTDATEPPFSCRFGSPGQGVNNMWYTFVATDTTAWLDTNSSTGATDTLLAVYDGTCGSLVEIACSEDEGVGLLSEVCVVGLTVGNTYYVQVGSFSATSVGSITLNIECPCPGAFDFCEGAIEVGCNSVTTFDNTDATTDATEPPFSCHFGGPAQGVNNVWYTFVATDTTAWLDTNSSAVSDTLLAVYDGTCGSLVEIACSEDEGIGLLSEVCVEGLTVGNTYYVQVGSFSALSVGSITLNIECPCAGIFATWIDIKPGSCPNPLNRGSHGVLPVALTGTADFDVTMVDVSTVRLERADGVGGQVAPNEGPPGPHSVFADVATPYDHDGCDCDDATEDGILDLSMKFRTDDVVTVLELDGLDNGDELELIITGHLLDGTPFVTYGDCILIVPMGTADLTVESHFSGLFVDLTPPDLNSDGGGFPTFFRTYDPGTTITLQAPTSADGLDFRFWDVDGVRQPDGETVISVTIIEGSSVMPVYGPLSTEPSGAIDWDGSAVPLER